MHSSAEFKDYLPSSINFKLLALFSIHIQESKVVYLRFPFILFHNKNEVRESVTQANSIAEVGLESGSINVSMLQHTGYLNIKLLEFALDFK